MKRHAKAHPPRPARLFGEPERPADLFVAHVDGASRNNPGPAAYGVVLRRPDGSVVETLSKYIGTKTNNEAEYFGLVAALDCAASHRIARLRVVSDSELLVRQMQGNYKVKSASLRPLHEQARKLTGQFAYIAFEHVPRAHNADADALANAALDKTATGSVAPGKEGGAETRKSHSSSPALSQPEKFDTRHSPARRSLGEGGRLATHEVRARYSGGALHPAEPLDLVEGEEVELTIKKATETPRHRG
jgi:probable phosphoglycerate mutase